MHPKAPSDGFDWFQYDGTNEDDAIAVEEPKPHMMAGVYEKLVGAAHVVVPVLLCLRLVSSLVRSTGRGNLNTILNALIVFVGALLVLDYTTRILKGVAAQITGAALCRRVWRMRQFLTVLAWTSLGYINIGIVEDELRGAYSPCKNALLCCAITAAAYALSVWAVDGFERFFIRKALRSKINEVGKTEALLRALKRFCYGITESSGGDDSAPGCPDLFHIDACCKRGEEHAPRTDDRAGWPLLARILRPAVLTKKDAMTLARDTFTRAAADGEALSFAEFAAIFNSDRAAAEAHNYFSTEGSRSIDRKTFREGVLYFYRSREVLQRSLANARHFVRMVGNFLYAFAFFVLVIVWFVVFGTSFRELLALALSSTLALNFIASGVLNESVRNFVMLLSHQFDIGDDVLVGSDALTVHSIGVASTSFLCANGGKIKILNSDLWRKTIVNISKAPEKKLVFSVGIPPTLSPADIGGFKLRVREFLVGRRHDYYDSFVLASSDAAATGLGGLAAQITLKYKGFKSKSKQFMMRAEFAAFLRGVSEEMDLGLR
ncbi:hypothetical protein PAPHI01_0524 [Pancytospora philotis]|nr:hypothetical protein PAPHI01_0524 [Pancytospora philotis]